MLKRLLLICTLAFALNSQAQFEIEHDTLYALGYAGKTASSFVDLEAHSKIKHTAMSQETIKWVRTTNTLQSSEWTSAVCDIISCRGTEVDTGSFQISGMDSGSLSFHFYPKNVRGTGTMVVRFFRENNPMDYHDVVIMCQAWTATSVNTISSELTSVYPNPCAAMISVNNSVIANGTYSILNSFGQTISTSEFVNDMTISTADLSSGVYTIIIKDGVNTSAKQFVKE
jgi:hypothetical protein